MYTKPAISDQMHLQGALGAPYIGGGKGKGGGGRGSGRRPATVR